MYLFFLKDNPTAFSPLGGQVAHTRKKKKKREIKKGQENLKTSIEL